MSKLDRIGAFIAVVEENSFAAAARKHGVSTAAISRQISRLEADLKTALLIRTTRQLSLTEIGEQYYQSCKKALAELTEAEIAISGSQNESIGILNVTSSRYFALHYIVPHLPAFMAQNPKLQIKIELAERFPNLATEDIDLVFGVSMDGPPELVRKRVTMTHYVVCASPTYFKKYGTPKSPIDLSKHRYLTHGIRKPNNVVTFKNNKEIHVEPIVWLNDSYAMRECALLGMGLVKLHEYIVTDALEDGRLVECLQEFREPPLPVYLYYQQNKYLPAKIRRFIDFYSSFLSISL